MRRWVLGTSVVLGLMTRAAPCQADIVLGAAGDYGVLVEPNVASYALTANIANIFGNVGIGTGVSPIQIGSEAFINAAPGFPALATGRLDLVDASTRPSPIRGTWRAGFISANLR